MDTHVGLQKNFEIVMEGEVILLSLRGNIGGLNLSALHEWSQNVFRKIKEEYEKQGKKIKVLMDTSGIKGYEPEALTSLANLVHEDDQYVYKTATFGAKPLIRLAEEAVFSLSGRDNCKAFMTKEKALQWLGE
ncbi:MAG: STAS/SEC14 domain-containing protein [Patescibacteria group bacterium]